MTSQFKAFGYTFQTANVRASPEAGFNVQQMKAGFDDSELKRIKAARRSLSIQQLGNTNVRTLNPNIKQKRFIM